MNGLTAPRKGRILRHVLMASTVVVSMATGVAALAQQQPQVRLNDTDVADIIVTARQRNETLLQAPVAVSAISGETLNKMGSTDTRDLVKLAPSLTIDRATSGAGGVISLRGIGTSPSNAGFDQAVSVNVDGVQTGRARIITLGMLDLAQIEVMKGPQALFFGKNSPAGVISITSAAPTSTFTARLRTGYEVVANEAIVEGMVSGPLTDSLGARVAVRYREMDGFLRNRAQQITSSPFAGPNNLPQAPGTTRPGDDELVGRVTLAFKPTGSPFSATLKVAGMSYHDDGPSAGQQVVNCGAFAAPAVAYAGIPTIAFDTNDNCKLDRNYSDGALPNGYADNWPVARQNPYSKVKMLLGSLTAVYDADDFTFTSVSGAFISNTSYFDNYDATLYMAYDAGEKEKYRAYSQEFRLLTTFDSPVNLMVGAFYQKTDLDFSNTVLIAPLPIDAATGKYHTWEKPGKSDGNTYSVFGQLIWNIVPKVELAGGVRYTHETKDSSMLNSYVHPPLSGTAIAAQGKVFADDFKDSNYSPEATLTWRPTDDLTTYVAYKTGYKSGGFGIGTNLVPANITTDSIRYQSEKIKGFEGGVKSRLFDHRITATASIYSYKYSNLQVNAFDAATTSFRISNAASARVKGVELELNGRITDWLTLTGGISYNSAKFLDYIAACWAGQTAATGCNIPNGNGTFSQDRSGQPLSRAPKWTGNGGIDTTFPLGSSMQIGFGTSTRYSDDYYANDNGNPFGIQKSFWLLDANARIGSADGKWEFALIGRNLTNEYYTGYIADKPGAPSTPGTTSQLMGLPNRGRQILLQATLNF